MEAVLRVNAEELRVTGAVWHLRAAELHAVPPALDAASGWPTMLASAAVTGAAQACTADLHTRIATTAGATQVSGTAYQAADSDAAELVKNVITTVTDGVRRNA